MTNPPTSPELFLDCCVIIEIIVLYNFFQIYQLLLQNLDTAQKRVRQHASSSLMSSMMSGGGPGAGPRGPGLEIEDVE